MILQKNENSLVLNLRKRVFKICICSCRVSKFVEKCILLTKWELKEKKHTWIYIDCISFRGYQGVPWSNKVILSISFYTLFTAPLYPQVPITAPFLLSYWSMDQYNNNTSSISSMWEYTTLERYLWKHKINFIEIVHDIII